PMRKRTPRFSLRVKSRAITDFSRELKKIIERLLSAGKSQIEYAADSVGVGKRTLQRRLAETGVSYSNLVDEVRSAGAITLVQDRSAKLCDIARDLGYSDAASFDRAFRRWTGLSPSSFRSMDPKSRSDLVRRLKSLD